MKTIYDYEKPTNDMIEFLDEYNKHNRETYVKYYIFIERLTSKGYTMNNALRIIERYKQIYV